MNSTVNNVLSTLEFKDQQECGNMKIFPILSPVEEGIQYITLTNALGAGFIKVTEIDDSGSVPELKVLNTADIPVFLLDGEELAGAKQNRVINTSILLKEKSETIIPVSCTEQGRWSFTSKEFYDSGVVMSRNIRAKKARAVAQSLKSRKRYDSDQGDIWNEIHYMSEKEQVHSPTSSMRDIYENKMKDLDEYMKAFPAMSKQKGILVTINDKVAGLDVVSRGAAFEELHPKIIKSYAMDAILQKDNRKKNGKHAYDDAMAFVEKSKKCNEKKYESVGHGWDYRFDGKGMVGSSLIHEEEVIHMSFFKADDSDNTGPMSSYSRRRGFRQ